LREESTYPPRERQTLRPSIRQRDDHRLLWCLPALWVTVVPAPGQPGARPAAKANGLEQRRSDCLVDKPNLRFGQSVEPPQDIVPIAGHGCHAALESFVRCDPGGIAGLGIRVRTASVVAAVMGQAAVFPGRHPLVGSAKAGSRSAENVQRLEW
jgi:hypothetical protein